MADDDDDEIVTDQTPITHIGMSMRLFHCLEREGIKTLGELRAWEEKDLLRTPNLGRMSLNELLSILKHAGIRLKEPPPVGRPPMPYSLRRLVETDWVLPMLWRRNLYVVRDRLDGMTLEQIGNRYGMTKERVRQVCGKYRRLITSALDAKNNGRDGRSS